MSTTLVIQLLISVLLLGTFIKAIEPIRPLTIWAIFAIIFFGVLMIMVFYPHLH